MKTLTVNKFLSGQRFRGQAPIDGGLGVGELWHEITIPLGGAAADDYYERTRKKDIIQELMKQSPTSMAKSKEKQAKRPKTTIPTLRDYHYAGGVVTTKTDAKEDGTGVAFFAHGVKYFGGWELGQKHGHGVELWASGRQYYGEWDHGVRKGFGCEMTGEGDWYCGQWSNDRPHGVGQMLWANGLVQRGYWCAGLYRGRGGQRRHHTKQHKEWYASPGIRPPTPTADRRKRRKKFKPKEEEKPLLPQRRKAKRAQERREINERRRERSVSPKAAKRPPGAEVQEEGSHGRGVTFGGVTTFGEASKKSASKPTRPKSPITLPSPTNSLSGSPSAMSRSVQFAEEPSMPSSRTDRTEDSSSFSATSPIVGRRNLRQRHSISRSVVSGTTGSFTTGTMGTDTSRLRVLEGRRTQGRLHWEQTDTNAPNNALEKLSERDVDDAVVLARGAMSRAIGTMRSAFFAQVHGSTEAIRAQEQAKKDSFTAHEGDEKDLFAARAAAAASERRGKAIHERYRQEMRRVAMATDAVEMQADLTWKLRPARPTVAELAMWRAAARNSQAVVTALKEEYELLRDAWENHNFGKFHTDDDDDDDDDAKGDEEEGEEEGDM